MVLQQIHGVIKDKDNFPLLLTAQPDDIYDKAKAVTNAEAGKPALQRSLRYMRALNQKQAQMKAKARKAPADAPTDFARA